MLKLRVITALVLLPIVLGAVFGLDPVSYTHLTLPTKA